MQMLKGAYSWSITNIFPDEMQSNFPLRSSNPVHRKIKLAYGEDALSQEKHLLVAQKLQGWMGNF